MNMSEKEIREVAQKLYPYKAPLNKYGEPMTQKVGQLNPPFWKHYQKTLNMFVAGALYVLKEVNKQNESI
jgi:hypothetical protein